MNSKKCFKCGVVKSLAGFYRHSEMADGYLGKCKDCSCADVRRNRAKRLEHYRQYDRKRGGTKQHQQQNREYAQTKRGREALKKAQRNYVARYPERITATRLTYNAIKSGRLVPQPCEVCGNERVDAHHDDYNKPLSVRWLCRKHHSEHHKKMRMIVRDAK